ncbi:MAG TPA: YkgJ family cysteine cluster protein [Kiritimatiellia bacterium]|nr:YkgJ family cysteine cluster protein [Kiritimatiellia bacterium]HSA19354.1 YkgJ family cysteine cluster protein [Kiritimatiellia bacterium]
MNPEPSPSFDCLRCGACCRWPGHVLLAGDDIPRLAAHLGISERDFIGRYAVLASNRRQLSLAEQPDGACVFLENNACRVYPDRPAQCRAFPLGWSVPGCPACPPAG